MDGLGVCGIVISSLLYLGYIFLGYKRYKERLEYHELYV